MKIVAPISEKKIKTLQKSSACGVVPGLWVKVVPLKNGELAKYFVLRERSINRTFNLGKYPDMSLAEAFKSRRMERKGQARGRPCQGGKGA